VPVLRALPAVSTNWGSVLSCRELTPMPTEVSIWATVMPAPVGVPEPSLLWSRMGATSSFEPARQGSRPGPMLAATASTTERRLTDGPRLHRQMGPGIDALRCSITSGYSSTGPPVATELPFT
jgi:hypothetical protein